MNVALWIVAACQVVQTSLLARAKGIHPIKKFRARNVPAQRPLRVTERA